MPSSKARELSPAEARDKQRHDDRQAELDRQAEVDAAMEKFYRESAAAAQQALQDQVEYETHGVRIVRGEP